VKEVNFVRGKLILLIALTLLIVLALQGIAELPDLSESWWDGG
jgi:hypothetical protein